MNKKHLLFYSILAILGITNTLMNIGILTFVNQMIQNKSLSLFKEHSVLWFSAIVLVSFLLNRYFQKKIIKFSNQVIYENELKIFKTLKETDLNKVQKLGKDKVYTVIEDLRLFSHLPNVIVTSIISLGTIIVCLIYFFVISPIAASVIFIIVAIMISVFYLVNKLVLKKIEKLRLIGEAYYQIIDDMLSGFKELKMSSIRNKNAYQFLFANRRETRDLEIETSNTLLTNNLFGNYGIFVLLGIIIFGLPHIDGVTSSEVVSFVVIILFISAPIQSLAALQSYYTKAFVAMKRIKKFIYELNATNTFNQDDKRLYNISTFENLSFEDVYFEYLDAQNNKAFELGPINLNIQKGETLFIIGGNGSGKSTFINLLTGLTNPTKGKIYLNNQLIETNDKSYRDLISAIFTNNHLFSKNYENYTLEENDEYTKLIHRMKLDNVITEYNEKNARRSFSKGQSKRVSMIFALLEKRPIMVLDEWAADQDPHFRKYFYEVILKDLKEQGKTTIAVTHDDAYFKHADRIIKFDYGKIVKEIHTTTNLSQLEIL